MDSERRPSEIGPWGEIKGKIIDRYLHAYLQILKDKHWCKGTLYIDAFAGSPDSVVRGTGAVLPGSTRRALNLTPGFTEYHFIDVDQRKTNELTELAADDARVSIYQGDGNEVLRSSIIPRLAYNEFRRGVVLLDPYGMDLDWDVVLKLGQSRSADVIINFPTMDINRNALRRDASTIDCQNAARMSRWWGDDSWREFYRQDSQTRLWDDPAMLKYADNEAVVRAYCERLKSVAGFGYASRPFPVKNSKNAVLYYLLMTSPKTVAAKIFDEIAVKFVK